MSGYALSSWPQQASLGVPSLASSDGMPVPVGEFSGYEVMSGPRRP